jgi:hypothetical protein
VQVEVLEGARPVAMVPVAALVDDSMGCRRTWTSTPCGG